MILFSELSHHEAFDIQHTFWVMSSLAGYKSKCGFSHPPFKKPPSLWWDLSKYDNKIYLELEINDTLNLSGTKKNLI